MQPKFNLIATLHAKPERRADLLKLLTSFVDKSRAEQGCIDYHFHVSLDDPNVFYFYENWAERADFDRHVALDYQKDWFTKQSDYLVEPVELKFFGMMSAYDHGAAHLARRPNHSPPLTADSQMTNEELRALNKTRCIQQIGWLTRDLERSMQAWIDLLRIGPWRVFRFTDKTVKNLRVGGRLVEEPFEFRIAITHVGNTEIELIQPVRGPMIYEEYLQRRGEGLHHIKERTADDQIAALVGDYQARGISVTQTGQFVADFHLYLNTEPTLDFVYELGNCPYQDLPPDMVSVYPPERTPHPRATQED